METRIVSMRAFVLPHYTYCRHVLLYCWQRTCCPKCVLLRMRSCSCDGPCTDRDIIVSMLCDSIATCLRYVSINTCCSMSLCMLFLCVSVCVLLTFCLSVHLIAWIASNPCVCFCCCFHLLLFSCVCVVCVSFVSRALLVCVVCVR